ncbi:MAG: TadE family protein [Planctomycetota bacterium]
MQASANSVSRVSRPPPRSRRGKGRAGQALVEFAVAFPLQLILVFGLMQLALLYVSTLVVNFTAYRCARAAIVGEHRSVAGGGLSGVDVVAQTLLSPLAGGHRDADYAPPEKVTIPDWGPIHRSDEAAAKLHVEIFEPRGEEAGSVTALVEFNQELVFPFVDRILALLLRTGGTAPRQGEAHLFGSEDTVYRGLRSGDYIAPGSPRGRIRMIGGVPHFVITRQCTLYRAAAIEAGE